MQQLPRKIGELKEQAGGEFVAEILRDARVGPGDYVLVDVSAPLYLLAQIETTSKSPERVDLGAEGVIERPVRRARGRFLSPLKWDPNSGSPEILTAAYLQEVLKQDLRGDVLAPAVKLLQSTFTNAIKDSTIPLQIGELRRPAEHVTVMIDGEKMNRHSCFLAQSGAGKSFALGVLVEELLVNCDAQVVVLDPNGDFRNFLIPKALNREDRNPATHPDLPVNTSRNKCETVSATDYDHFVERIEPLGIAILRCESNGPDQVLLDFRKLTAAEKRILLDFQEPDMLLAWRELQGVVGVQSTLEQLREGCGTLIAQHIGTSHESRAARFAELHVRIEQVESMGIWAPAGAPRPYLDCLSSRESALVCLCLDGLGRLERSVLMAKALALLWNRQEKDRAPTFIVVDEAHNVAPVHPANGFEAMTLDLLVRIADEGRKYGLFQIVVTQRPSKIHPSVLAGCHNFFVMRMTDRADIQAIESAFTGVSEQLLRSMPAFTQGEALILGPVAKWPLTIRFGRRRMREGGQDIDIEPR